MDCTEVVCQASGALVPAAHAHCTRFEHAHEWRAMMRRGWSTVAGPDVSAPWCGVEDASGLGW